MAKRGGGWLQPFMFMGAVPERKRGSSDQMCSVPVMKRHHSDSHRTTARNYSFQFRLLQRMDEDGDRLLLGAPQLHNDAA